MTDLVFDAATLVTQLVGDRADGWDRDGRLPVQLVRSLAANGLLCAQVPTVYGGMDFSSMQNGELTAHVGSLCSSLRSLMTSQGMAAWTVQRFGDAQQRIAYLPQLTSGSLAGVAFSEPSAGSDLSAITTSIHAHGDTIVVEGEKVWVTGGEYADLLVVFGRYANGVAAVMVPVDAPGVTIRRVSDPLGCRAAGHADIRLDTVRLPADALLGGADLPMEFLTTAALMYGRLSVAWGCVGIMRACLKATTRHASTRKQSGKPLADHQLVARHLTELLVAEQAATRCCQDASRCWDCGSAELGAAVMVAKHFAAGSAARCAAAAVQVLAGAGAIDGHPVARAYRDAKLMEIIEGSNEICQLLLSKHALAVWS